MTVGAAMAIVGNIALVATIDNEGDLGGTTRICWIFGWILGPLAHAVGIGVMGGGLAQLSDTNTVRPVSFDLALAARSSTARVTFAF
jgi:hypothetical protein